MYFSLKIVPFIKNVKQSRKKRILSPCRMSELLFITLQLFRKLDGEVKASSAVLKPDVCIFMIVIIKLVAIHIV